MNPVGLILLTIVAGGGLLWLKRQPAAERTKAAFKLALLMILLGLLFLAITGRLHWLGALVALMLPFAQRMLPLLMRFLPWLQRNLSYKNRQNRKSGKRSSVSSRMIAMTLDHDSGAMDGEVLRGSLEGRRLETLNREEFLQLLRECRQSDVDSTRLLETYLDKRFGSEWRADDPYDHPSGNDGQNGSMSRDEALEILGLQPGASREEIIEAHRRLMQRNHPDRGGSTWLAARINEAKSLLLAD
ncbi:molecular chaperone DnaJ [Marinobacterium sp. YM272]|uniref:molecular chaperone DnaJ n=1 Tax=Marinobacterium sp. YM272 TaxID=3421654 RepID=UPI003D7FAAAD